MNFITYDELNKCICRNLYKIPRDIDLVVGIPRSGTLAGNIIALYLNLPFMDIDSYVRGASFRTGNTRKNANWIKSTRDAKKILVVDDSISSGQAIKEAKQQIKHAGEKSEYVYLAVYALETNIFMVDIYFEICHMPRMFEWNYMHHWVLEYACVDIDGVLCYDPSLIQNDDGKRYEDFLLNAVPKFIPTKKIGYIISTRLEKYRWQTETWLKNYGIEYDHLIMLDLPSGIERRKQGSYGNFKGEFFKQTQCSIFIESSYEQAVEICRVSGKQVFCTDKSVLITPPELSKHLKILENDWRITTKRVVRKLLEKL